MLHSHLYSGCQQGEGYKRVAEPRLFLSHLVYFKEASALVKKQEEEKLSTLHTVNSKLILHFPAKDLQ